ncbi:MAG TPA: TonB family protein [Pyrinomonadaceae bacterium]|nr:TonB family protein [Pyrinomonadaceae bacterium]
MSDFDAKFMQDEELRDLLRQWNVPSAPRSLDNRVAAAYQQSMSSPAASDSVFHPQRDSEVVKMKFCNTCQEEFADRFSFCPVDGTPLSAAPSVSAPPPEPVAPVETVTAAPPRPEAPPTPIGRDYAAAASGNIGEYHLTILEDTGLASRLAGELGNVAHNYQLTWPEFKRDPFGFVKRSIQGYGKMAGGFFGSRDVMIATLLSVVAMAVMVGAIFLLDRTQSGGPSRRTIIVIAVIGFVGLLAVFATWLSRDRGAAVMGARPSDSRNVLSGIIAAFAVVFLIVGGALFLDMRHRAAAAAKEEEEQVELTQMITDIPPEQPTPDEGNAGMAKGSGGGSKAEKIKPGGGGGGGREEQNPASAGKLPQASLTIPQVVAPDPHPPVIKNPSLPMPATLDADPVLFPPDTRNLQYGDPKSKSTTPSSGPGTGNGIGSGTGGGVGPGSGGGYGPGEGGNTGGGPRREGGGGPGGGGGGTDYNRIFKSGEVTSRARVLSKPEPQYTESARKNQITGTVVLRAVFSSSGSVMNISTIRGLPDGLTERAIAAAKQIRFVPAQKDGHPVSMWMQLEYNFNLY